MYFKIRKTPKNTPVLAPFQNETVFTSSIPSLWNRNKLIIIASIGYPHTLLPLALHRFERQNAQMRL